MKVSEIAWIRVLFVRPLPHAPDSRWMNMPDGERKSMLQPQHSYFRGS